MRKRILSWIMASVMLWCYMVPMLTGCSSNVSENKYTVAEWLSKVEENFNMLYYTESEPLVQTVRSDSEYFDVVQIAAEWGLISAEDGLDFDKYITKEFCADTLAKATNFDNVDTFDGISDADSISDKYIGGVRLALDEGIFALDASGKFDPKHEMTKEEADLALVAARNAWTNFSFDGECYDKSIVKENVINLGGVNSENSEVVDSSYKVDYSGNLSVIDADGNYCDNSTKTITFAADQAPDMEVGSVLAMPGDNVIPMDYAVVVDSITNNADGTVTVATHNAELDEVYDEVEVRQSGKVDFSESKFIFPDGEIVDMSEAAVEDMSFSPAEAELVTTDGLYVFDNQGKVNLKAPKMKSKKLSDGLTLSYGISKDTLAFSVHSEVEVNGIKYEVEFSEDKNFNIEKDIHLGYNWLHIPNGIKKLYLALNINTTQNLMLKVSGSGEVDFSPAKEVLEPDDLKNVYDQLSDKLKKIKNGGSSAEELCSVKLFDIVIPNTCLHFTVKLAVTFEGTLTFTIEKHEKYGVDYCKGNLRFINDNSEERTITFDGKIEIVAKLSVSASILGVSIIDVGADAGVGMTVSSKVFLKNPATDAVEAEFALPMGISDGSGSNKLDSGISLTGNTLSHQNIESCLEINVYPIVRLNACNSGTLAHKLIGKSFNQEILGEDNPILTIHYEGGKGIVEKCSRENTGDNIDIEVGKTVTANYDKYVMAVGEQSKGLKLLTIPEGIKPEDVKITSSDPSVVVAANAIQYEKTMQRFRCGLGSSQNKVYYKEYSKVDVDHFILKGVTDGVATLTINAGGQTCQVEVVVGSGGITNESEGRFVIQNTSMNLKVGEIGKVLVDSAPNGYSLADAVFSSTNTEVAAVDQNGNVTAGSVGGSAIIYVSTGDGKFTGACIVNVY